MYGRTAGGGEVSRAGRLEGVGVGVGVGCVGADIGWGGEKVGLRKCGCRMGCQPRGWDGCVGGMGVWVMAYG